MFERKYKKRPTCTVEITQYALKGLKLLAQGIALGNLNATPSPCKGKSFKTRQLVKLLPFLVYRQKYLKIREPLYRMR